MPDRRRHRGPGPKDHELFAREQIPRLREAAGEFCWLLDRGYPELSTLALVGNRHQLVARQREALMRACCPAKLRDALTASQVARSDRVWIDGYNVLVTVEAALSGGLVLSCRDLVYRDLASVHGSYRRVEETIAAVDLVHAESLDRACSELHWVLDRQIGNSGRLAEILRARLAQMPGLEGTVELAGDADRAVAEAANRGGGAVASADRVVLAGSERWVPLARQVIEARVPSAWRLELHP